MIDYLPGFLEKVSEALGIDSSQSVSSLSVQDIIGGQGPQIPTEIIKFLGGMMESDAEMGSVAQFGNFTFKEFESKEELEAYLAAPDYHTPDKPGMCFGFSVSESEDKKKYELEVFSNDKWPYNRRFSPDREDDENLRY